ALAAALAGVERIEIEQLSGRAARDRCAAEAFDCILVVAQRPGPAVFSLLESLREPEANPNAATPLVVELAEPPQGAALERIERSGALCATGRGTLLDEVTRLLHVRMAELPEEAREAIRQLRRHDPVLAGRKV